MMHFDWSDFDASYDERPYYMEISAHDDEGWEGSIITNRAGEGLFYWDRRKKEYHQELGTCQFHLPGSKSGIRRLFHEMREQDRAE